MNDMLFVLITTIVCYILIFVRLIFKFKKYKNESNDLFKRGEGLDFSLTNIFHLVISVTVIVSTLRIVILSFNNLGGYIMLFFTILGILYLAYTIMCIMKYYKFAKFMTKELSYITYVIFLFILSVLQYGVIKENNNGLLYLMIFFWVIYILMVISDYRKGKL